MNLGVGIPPCNYDCTNDDARGVYSCTYTLMIMIPREVPQAHYIQKCRDMYAYSIMGMFAFEGILFGWIQRETKRTPTILGGSPKNHKLSHINICYIYIYV